MPDISNEDVMKLVCRVMKKVDILEEKLDEVLSVLVGQRREKKVVEDEEEFGEEIDYTFKFSPIGSDEELDYVSRNMDEDENYRKNLRLLMQSKGNLRLEHIFTSDFLFHYNPTGSNGKKRLEGLVPYDQIFISLKIKAGYTEEEIKKAVMAELCRIKNRIHKRKSMQFKRNQQKESGVSKVDDVVVEQVEPIPCKIEVQEFETEDLDLSDDENVSNDTKNYAEQVFIQEPQEHMDDVTYDDYDDEVFAPIRNDDELERVSQKIRNNPQFLKNLRLQIVEESDNGQCTLEQIFTLEFLQNCNLNGKHDNKKLSDLTPYKAIYFYIKKHLGQSLKEIEMDAVNELKRLKNRMAARRKIQRKRGELPPYVKKKK